MGFINKFLFSSVLIVIFSTFIHLTGDTIFSIDEMKFIQNFLKFKALNIVEVWVIVDAALIRTKKIVMPLFLSIPEIGSKIDRSVDLLISVKKLALKRGLR